MGLFSALRLAKRVSELEEVVTKLESQWEKRDLDWIEIRARCRRLLDRTEKAAHRADAAEPVVDSETLGGSNGGESASTTMPGRLLTPRQKEIQQQVLRRRAGLQ